MPMAPSQRIHQRIEGTMAEPAETYIDGLLDSLYSTSVTMPMETQGLGLAHFALILRHLSHTIHLCFERQPPIIDVVVIGVVVFQISTGGQ